MESGEQRRAKIADCLRRRKVRLKSIHICQDCGMRPPFEDKTLCVACLESRRKLGREYRAHEKALDIASKKAY
jgi:ribosomal protein L37E